MKPHLSTALFGAILICTGCLEEQAEVPTGIPIGVVIDRSGNNSEPSWVDSIKLARRHANLGLRKAGLQELQFSIVVADSGNEPQVALTRAADLTRNKGARALILDTSQNDIAVHRTYYDADPANDLNVPLVCGSCTTSSLNNANAVDADPATQQALRNSQGWNYRCLMSTKLISEVLVGLMLRTNNGDVNGDGRVKVAYYGSDEAFGRGTVKDLKAYLTEFLPGTPPVVEEHYHPRDADVNSYSWAADMAKLTNNVNDVTGEVDGEPDFIAVANFAVQQSATIKAHRQSGTNIRMLHYHSSRFSSVITSLGSQVEGAEGVSHVLVEGASGETFANDFNQLYGVNVVYRDANYYDAAMTLMLAAVISINGQDTPDAVTGQSIRDAMLKTSDLAGEPVGTGGDEFARAVALIREGKPINYQGASGPMDFDALGNVVGRLAHFRAEKGAFIDVQRFDCVKDSSCPEMP